jgi:phospholipid/cholesterol/gamma-HCH transport system ATP-binding protein
LVVKQRDFYGTTAMLVTHRLQDAFVLATHYYDAEKKSMQPIPNHGLNANTSFLVLNDGKVVFDGSTAGLVHSNDPFLKEYLA